MTNHSLLSPSTAHRWMVCPGSVAMGMTLPDEPSEYAQEGTVAHALAESMLNGTEYEVPPEYDTAELREHVQTYVDFVTILGGLREVEVGLDLSHWLGPHGFGTADAVVWCGTELYVCDLKYGMTYVDAVHNPQIALYAMGYLSLVQKFDCLTKVHLCIVQPRVRSVSQWDLTPAELRDFAEVIQKKALIARTMTELPEDEWICVPKESACRYCRARHLCPKLSGIAKYVAESDSSDMSPTDLADAYGYIGLVRLWADAVEKAVYGKLLHGERVPGLKLVEGRKGVRKWRSEAAAIKAIEAAGIQADVYERKLLSPAKMEKLTKDKTITKDQWSALAPEIIQETTKPTIADETDKRPAYEPQALDYPNMEENTNG